MIDIKFHQDQEGYLRATTEPQYSLLSQYFESEIQGIAAICQALLATVKEIEIGDRPSVEGIGNGYGLKLTSQKATIWSEFTETILRLELSLGDFKQALEDCLIFLQSLELTHKDEI